MWPGNNGELCVVYNMLPGNDGELYICFPGNNGELSICFSLYYMAA